MQRKSCSSPFLTIVGAMAFVGAPFLVPHVAYADIKSTLQTKTSTFYGWYVGQLKRDQDPFRDRAMMHRIASRRLEKWLYSPAYREYDADYFLRAQDFDHDWGTLRTTSFRLTGGAALLGVVLGQPKPPEKGIGERKLQLKWVREGGSWKLDRVNTY